MKRRFVGIVWLCAAGAAAQNLPSRISDNLRAENLKADVAFLASDTLQGRATPSPGLDAAAEYIASQFRKAGLEPVGDDGYFQTATYQLTTPNLEGFEVRVGATKIDPILQQPAATDLTDADVVHAALGEVDKLTVEQVRGKVLILTAEAGFRGMRQLPNPEKLEPALVIVALPNLPRGMGGRPAMREAPATPPKFATLLIGADAVKDAARVSAHIRAPKVEIVKCRNVAGLIRGGDPILKDTYLVVTGHYDHLGVRGTGEGDHIFNGANDDASGTSSVIEIGTALAALGEKPKRSILFLAVFGEESGGYGARYYTGHPIFPLAKTIADVNLEQLGRTDDTEGPRVGAFNLTGFDYTDIASTMAKAGAETGIHVVKHETNSDAFFSRSDNATFADAGVPSTTISVAYVYPDYHAAGDEWPKLDYDNMAKVDVCIGLGLWNMANADRAPEWNRENPKASRYAQKRDEPK